MSTDQPDEVIELFTERKASGGELPAAAWTKLFEAYASKGESKAMLLAKLAEMKETGVVPEAETFDVALACCARGASGDAAADPAADVADALALREQMAACDAKPTMSTFESLITVQLRANDIPSARALMEEMHQTRVAGRYRASIAYLAACVESNQLDEAVTYLGELHASQRPPGGNDMRRLLRGFTAKRHLSGAMTTAEMMLEMQDTFDPMPLIVTMANLHAFDEHPARAELLLGKCVRLIRPDMQPAYWNKDRLHVLTRCLPLLPDTSSKMTVLNVINLRRFKSRELTRAVHSIANAGVQAVDDAYHALEDMAQAGTPVATGTLNNVIQMCGNIQDLDRAVETFEAISKPPFNLKPDVDSYNALMMAAHREREVGAVMQVHIKMREAGIEPNAETYRVLIMSKLADQNVLMAHELLQQAVDAGKQSAGQYAVLINFHLGIRVYGNHGAKKRNVPKAVELRDAAHEHGLKLNPPVLEGLERALSERARVHDDASSGGGAEADSSDYEEAFTPVMGAAGKAAIGSVSPTESGGATGGDAAASSEAGKASSSGLGAT